MFHVFLCLKIVLYLRSQCSIIQKGRRGTRRSKPHLYSSTDFRKLEFNFQAENLENRRSYSKWLKCIKIATVDCRFDQRRKLRGASCSSLIYLYCIFISACDIITSINFNWTVKINMKLGIFWRTLYWYRISVFARNQIEPSR